MKPFFAGCLLGLAASILHQVLQNLNLSSRKEEPRRPPHNPDVNAPLLILHVGPQKTATSTIQLFARTHLQELRHDNVFFLGHWKHPGAFNTHEISNICRARHANPEKCTQAWSNLALVVNSSWKKHIHFDMIAVEAHKRGMITNEAKARAAVADAVENFAANTLNWTSIQDFPRQSLTKDQSERFLKNSIESAKMLPNKSPHWEKDIVEGFFEFEKSGKFDSVDLEAVLNDPRWQDFFRNL